MGNFGPSTVVAVATGVVLAVLAFIPVAAHRYRARGRLRFLDLVGLLVVAVYAMALWTYTLIPVPEATEYRCAGTNLVPFTFVHDILNTIGSTSPLRNPDLLQALFNVVLFLPLGVVLRWLAKRGVVVATLVGLGISAVIEFTQLTGAWGLFPCAYRVFDVDDLILNTSGALLGSLIAWPFVRLLRDRAPVALPAKVTLGRRLVGVLVDLMVVTFIGASLVVAWNATEYLLLYSGPSVEPGSGPLAAIDTSLPRWLLGWLPALLVEGWWVLARGRTCGEAVVALRPVYPDGRTWLRRLVKLVAGVGGYLALTAVPSEVSIILGAFSLTSLIAILATKDRRGLSGLVARLPLATEQPAESAEPSQTADRQ